MNKFIAHLRLMRPANIITAIADILLGYAASGSVIQFINTEEGWLLNPDLSHLGWLVLSSIGLYGGGVVFNDVFDAELDKIERPERPIPSGQASRTSSTLLGGSLLLLGIIAAAQVSALSSIIALAVAIMALIYDAFGKHHPIIGPLNMGLCRGGNLLLGISATPIAIAEWWYLSLIPIVYIAAITIISRGEVHGANRLALKGGMVIYGIVITAIGGLALLVPSSVFSVLPFILLFAFLIFPPLYRALNNKNPKFVGKAVKAGVLSLIVMDAAMAAVFAEWQYGLLVLSLLPVSIFLAKSFAVT